MPKCVPLRNLCAPLALLLPFLTCAIAGCGGGQDLEPVTGQVKNGPEVLKTGSVRFLPDKDKGNKSEGMPRAEIAEDGTYTLYTAEEEGAPAGWYKVVVVAEAPPAEGADQYAPPTFLVQDQYMSVETTPLSIEVKADAPEGHYDISLDPR